MVLHVVRVRCSSFFSSNFNSTSLLTSVEKEHFEVVQVLLAADFSLCTTNKGQVYFAGKAEALGLNKVDTS